MRRIFLLFIILIHAGSRPLFSQTITTGTIQSSLCAGDTVLVPYTLTGSFQNNNIFRVQLSDPLGSFTSPLIIGSVQAKVAGTIRAYVSSGTAPGTAYRIRVVSTNPGVTGSQSAAITINTSTLPSVSIAGNAGLSGLCGNASVSFTASALNAGSSPSYQWKKNGLNVGANTASFSDSVWSAGDYIECVITSNAVCPLPVSVWSNRLQVDLSDPASGSWQQKSDFGSVLKNSIESRRDAVAFGIGKKGYFGTGRNQFSVFNDFWEYDPAADVWTQRADFAGPARYDAVGFGIGSKGYVGTGTDNVNYYNDFWQYDPASNNWTQKANFGGVARSGATGFSILKNIDKGYIGTGLNASGGYIKDFWEYDPIANTWTSKSQFAGTARSDAVGFSVGNRGYLGTGSNASTFFQDFYMYDPIANSWTAKTNFGGGLRSGASGFSLTDKGYIGTGINNSSVYLNDFWEYDTLANAWTSKASLGGVARSGAIGLNIENTGYIGGGFDGSYKNDFFRYDAGANSWSARSGVGYSASPRSLSVGFSIGAKGYFGTGTSGSRLSDFWEFDPAGNVWTQKANFGGNLRANAVGFGIQNKGYIGTGVNSSASPSSDFWEYDPVANNWTAKANFGGGTATFYNSVGFCIGNKGYIGTGRSSSIRSNVFWEYDPAGNAWTQKANFGGTARERATGFSIGNKGYIGCGSTDLGLVNDFWQYDPVANIWTQKANFGGVSRLGAVGVGINGKGYMGTGEGAGLTLFSDFWEYDTLANTWTQKSDLPGGPRKDASGFSIGSKGYLGLGVINSVPLNDFWEFSTASNTIVTGNASSGPYCPGNNITVPFSPGCVAFNSGNIFSVQLSDSSGSFISPINLVTVSSGATQMTATLPSSLIPGSNYRIRVISSNPVAQGSPSTGRVQIAGPGLALVSDSLIANQVVCSNTAISPINFFTADTLNTSVSGLPAGVTKSFTANNLIISGSPSASGTFDYTVTNSGPLSCGALPFTGRITVRSTGYWIGLDSNWNNINNWCGGIPTGTSNVIITSGTAFSPVVSAGTAEVNDLTIQSGGSLKVNGQVLRVRGLINNAGTLNIQNGSLELNGTISAQSISGSMFLMKTIKDLKLSNSNGISLSGLNDTLKVTGQVSFGKSNVTFNTNGNLVLVSDSAGTASVGNLLRDGSNLLSGNRILGNVTVERYIPLHPKAWQFLSTPASGQTIKQAWQEGGLPLTNPNPGYGTAITSNLANPVSLGFDFASFTPAMKVYNSSTQAYVGIAATNIPIANNKGYMLFVRGDRSVMSGSQAATSLRLRMKGVLRTPVDNPPDVINVPPGAYESVGNPYASAIDFSKLVRTGDVQDVFYLWDPRLTDVGINSSFGVGGFQTFTRNLNGIGYTVMPGGGSYAAGNTNIESGAAFFVRSLSSGGTITFSEDAKVSGSANVFRPFSGSGRLRTSLVKEFGGDYHCIDGALSEFQDSLSDRTDILDVFKLSGGSSPSIAIMKQGNALCVERTGFPRHTDTIHYQLSNLSQGKYLLEFTTENIDRFVADAYLMDKYLNENIPVSLDGVTRISFERDSRPESGSQDRFCLVFSRKKLKTSQILRSKSITERKLDLKVPETIFRVYPNPVTANKFILSGIKIEKGSHILSLTDNQGKSVFRMREYFSGGYQQMPVDLPLNISKGTYILNIRKSFRQIFSLPLVIQ